MGLDISAYSNIKVERVMPEYDERYEDSEHWRIEYINTHFPHAIEGTDWDRGGYLLWTETPETEQIHFRAGSYSGYNFFRATLAEFSFGLEPTTVGSSKHKEMWNHIDTWRGEPFWEMINFSDAEGTIGPKTCEKLFTDFDVHRQRFVDKVKEEDFNYYVDLYDDWTKAFRLGSQNGIVSFH